MLLALLLLAPLLLAPPLLPFERDQEDQKASTDAVQGPLADQSVLVLLPLLELLSLLSLLELLVLAPVAQLPPPCCRRLCRRHWCPRAALHTPLLPPQLLFRAVKPEVHRHPTSPCLDGDDQAAPGLPKLVCRK